VIEGARVTGAPARAWRLLVQRGFPEDVVERLIDVD